MKVRIIGIRNEKIIDLDKYSLGQQLQIIEFYSKHKVYILEHI